MPEPGTRLFTLHRSFSTPEPPNPRTPVPFLSVPAHRAVTRFVNAGDCTGGGWQYCCRFLLLFQEQVEPQRDYHGSQRGDEVEDINLAGKAPAGADVMILHCIED